MTSDTMEFRTDRLTIRNWKESDYKGLYECAKDPAVARSAGWKPHESEDESLELIRAVLNGEECYAICCDDEVVGCVELYDYVRSNMGIHEKEYELGCWMGRKKWFTGLMQEALPPILDHAFGDLGAERVIVPIYYEGIYGHTIAKEVGFVELSETELPELCSSELRDGIIYCHTPETWNNFKKSE